MSRTGPDSGYNCSRSGWEGDRLLKPFSREVSLRGAILVVILAITCCFGQSCEIGTLPVDLADNAEQVLGYRPPPPTSDVSSPLPVIAEAGGNQLAQPNAVV